MIKTQRKQFMKSATALICAISIIYAGFFIICGRSHSYDYDIVIGGIANDRVIVTLDRYFAGELSQEETLGLLRFEKPNIQYCIRSERMIKECLTSIVSEKI